MNKRILGIKIKMIIGFIIIMLVIITVSVFYNRSVMDKWSPTDSLTGEFSGESEVYAWFRKGQSPSEYPEDWIDVKIIIDSDGRVTGTVGDARLSNGTIKQNRTWFERLVNIKTDYIIAGFWKAVLSLETKRKKKCQPAL